MIAHTTWIDSSLPPSDRPDRPEPPAFQCDEALRSQITTLRRPHTEGGEALSNAVIARAVGYSDAVISQYISGQYPGDVPRLETALREWLRDRRVAAASGVKTIETDVTHLVARKLEEVRNAGELGLLIGPAGIGKSRSLSRYLQTHTLAICFRCRPYKRGLANLAREIAKAAGIDKRPKGEPLWDTIIKHTAGSGRLLVVDDAHELSPGGLQCCVDWHEETGNPVVLVGLDMLKRKLARDDRRARRVGEVCPVATRDPQPLIDHLISQLAPGLSDRAGLLALARQVAAGPGCFGSLEKQLRFAARARSKKPDLAWPEAFRAAHQRLIRTYTLS
jgi:DNA transposition AAA+ family ATPase